MARRVSALVGPMRRAAPWAAWRVLSTSAAPWGASQPSAPAREQMHYDVCIVGAGPAGLAAAIRFKQLCKAEGKDFSVCIIEKGSEVGAHVLSGNVLDLKAIDELFPERAESEELQDMPLGVPASKDFFYFLTERRALRLPTPRPMRNKGNRVISLSELCRWLGRKAEDLGVEVYPGFAGKEVLYDWHGAVAGVATGDFGVARDGTRKDTYAPGVDLISRVTLFGEGARGSLSESLKRHFGLADDPGVCPQTYALGIKEVWEVPEEQAKPGHVYHTVGYPLPNDTYGGGFLYHMSDRRIALGLVVGLDYPNPYLSPFQEFQRWKAHPLIAKQLEGGTCLQYGARTLTEGGVQAIPKVFFPGGALIGCSAGFLNVPRIKGTHTAMKSGMLAAEEAFRALSNASASTSGGTGLLLTNYPARLEGSWVYSELEKVRNIRPGYRFGGLLGFLANAAVSTYLTWGYEPWTLRWRHADHEATRPAKECSPIEYPKPDGRLTFDLPTSLYRSGTNHEHDQPPHLTLRRRGEHEVVNLPHYAAPETRYCPAGVYEYSPDEAAGGRPSLRINAQNCLHCKACDVKDVRQNLRWTVPEGGGGPNYTVM